MIQAKYVDQSYESANDEFIRSPEMNSSNKLMYCIQRDKYSKYFTTFVTYFCDV